MIDRLSRGLVFYLFVYLLVRSGLAFAGRFRAEGDLRSVGHAGRGGRPQGLAAGHTACEHPQHDPTPFSPRSSCFLVFFLFWSLLWYSGDVSRTNHAEATLNRIDCIIGIFPPACLVTL